MQGVQPRGRSQRHADMILSVLSLGFEAGKDGGGTVEIILAGDGALRLSVEAIEARLKDVTKPYTAPSRRAPSHPQE